MKVYFSLFFLWCVVWFFCSIILLLLSFFSLRLLVNVYACGGGVCCVSVYIFLFSIKGYIIPWTGGPRRTTPHFVQYVSSCILSSLVCRGV
jgi:hypothetical protein